MVIGSLFATGEFLLCI